MTLRWHDVDTKRPALAQHQVNEHSLAVKAPDADAIAVFDAVKHDALHKIQELHHKVIVSLHRRK